MTQFHSFAANIPELPKFLILGSFPGKENTQNHTHNDSEEQGLCNKVTVVKNAIVQNEKN